MNKNLGRGKISKVLLAAAFMVFFAGNAFAIQLDFSNDTNGYITFNGDSTFDFTNLVPMGYDFHITGGIGLTDGTTVGLQGHIGGLFTIGTVVSPAPGLEIADVTGPGTFYINDATMTQLTGNIDWVKISTYQASGALNSAATMNITNLSYSGLNADLQALYDVGTLSFQFAQLTSVTYLKENFVQNSYSGTMATHGVPEPGTMLLLGTGLLGLGLMRRKKSA